MVLNFSHFRDEETLRVQGSWFSAVSMCALRKTTDSKGPSFFRVRGQLQPFVSGHYVDWEKVTSSDLQATGRNTMYHGPVPTEYSVSCLFFQLGMPFHRARLGRCVATAVSSNLALSKNRIIRIFLHTSMMAWCSNISDLGAFQTFRLGLFSW